ncbi:MAG: hypothetical protein ACR2LM_19825 [Pyrinomonadaceae bacterium]
MFYTHQTPANLCHAVDTLTNIKLGKVVRFKRTGVSGVLDPSATADGTDLMTRRSRVPETTKRRQVAALQTIAPSSRHREVEQVSAQQHEDVSVRTLAN